MFFDVKMLDNRIPVYGKTFVVLLCTTNCANQQEEYPRPIFITYLVNFGYASTLSIWAILRCTRGKRLRIPMLKGQVVIVTIAVLGFICVTTWTFSLQVRTRSVSEFFHVRDRSCGIFT